MQETPSKTEPSASIKSNISSPQLSSINSPIKSLSGLDTFILQEEQKLRVSLEAKRLEWTKSLQEKQKELEAKRLERRREKELKNLKKEGGQSALQKWKEAEEKRIERIDKGEKEILEKLKENSSKTWSKLTSEHESRIQKIQSDQSAKLSRDQAILNSAIHNVGDFDRRAFEFIVEKCGKGRDSGYGREKMSRFWELFDRMHGKEVVEAGNVDNANIKVQQEVLNALKGINLDKHESPEKEETDDKSTNSE